MGKISMTGYAEMKIKADMTRYTITFEKTGASLSECMNTVIKQCESFLGQLKEIGFDLKMIHMEGDDTSDIGFHDEQIKFKRKISFETNFDMKVENAIMNIIEANHYSAQISTTYLFSTEDDYREKLMKEAIEDSKRKATLAAEVINEEIVGIRDMSKRNNRLREKSNLTESKDARFVLMDVIANSDDLASPEEIISEEVSVIWKTKNMTDKGV